MIMCGHLRRQRPCEIADLLDPAVWPPVADLRASIGPLGIRPGHRRKATLAKGQKKRRHDLPGLRRPVLRPGHATHVALGTGSRSLGSELTIFNFEGYCLW